MGGRDAAGVGNMSTMTGAEQEQEAAVGAGTRTTTIAAGRGNENKATSVKQKQKEKERKENKARKLPHRMRANGSYFGLWNVRISIYIIYACCYYLLLIMAAAGSSNVVNGLKCYCNPKECDVIRALDCPGKGLMLWDPCQWVHSHSLPLWDSLSISIPYIINLMHNLRIISFDSIHVQMLPHLRQNAGRILRRTRRLFWPMRAPVAVCYQIAH